MATICKSRTGPHRSVSGTPTAKDLNTSIALMAMRGSACAEQTGLEGTAADDGAEIGTKEEHLYGLGTIGTAWSNGVVPVCFVSNTFPALQAKIPDLLI